jgi:hypothetical protein
MAPQSANTNNNESSTIEPNDTNTSGADDNTPPVGDDEGGGVTLKKKITAANASKSFRSGLIANEDIMEDAGQVRVDEAQLWGTWHCGGFSSHHCHALVVGNDEL